MIQENIPLQPGEEIRPIQGYEGLYSITSFGRVWSHEKVRLIGNNIKIIKARFLKSRINKGGYLIITLHRERRLKTFTIHQLVALQFIENSNRFPMINHKDGDKLNNNKDNLEWCDQDYNIKHAMENNLLKYKKSSKHYGVQYSRNKGHKLKPWRACIKRGGLILIGCYRTEIEAAKAYNEYIIRYNLNRCLNYIDEKKYLESIIESKKLIRNKGVRYVGNKGLKHPWRTVIKHNNKAISLGFHKTEIEAAQVYNKYIIEHNLNRPLNILNKVD